jgi:hypothetical protein
MKKPYAKADLSEQPTNREKPYQYASKAPELFTLAG